MIRKSFIKEDDIIYTVESGALSATSLSEPLSEEDYLTHGADDLTDTPFDELGHVFEILTYAGYESEQTLRLTFGLPHSAIWRRSFVKKNNVIYTVESGALVATLLQEPLSEEDYLSQGTNLLHTVPVEELGESFEILTYTEADDPQQARLILPPSIPLDWLEDDSPTLITYSTASSPPELMTTLEVEQKVLFWVSKDEHQTRWSFSGGSWKEYKEHLPEEERAKGMTIGELQAITPAEWADWFEYGTLDFYIELFGVRVPGANDPYVESITVEFPPNEAPLIENFTLTPDEFHNEYVELRATLIDQEGDPVKYRVLVGDTQVYPTDGSEWSPEIESGKDIFLAYNHPYFSVGENEITLIVTDDRGEVRQKSGTVVLINTPPTITLSYTDFSLRATLGDEDGDDVAYRLLINGEEHTPWSDFMPTPTVVSESWSSTDLILDAENTLTLEVKDVIEEVTSTEFKVVGKYQGLLFIDEEGNYYTSDQGEVLKELDFGSIVAGRITEAQKIILINQTGQTVENPSIDTEYNIPDVQIQLSNQVDPFEPAAKLNLQALQDSDEHTFYVRISPDQYAETGGVFKIKSNTME